MNIPMPLDATRSPAGRSLGGDGPPIRRRAACNFRAMGKPFVTFACSYVHTIFCCFSVFVPFDTSLTVPRWLHNLQTKRRPEAGIYPAGQGKCRQASRHLFQAGKEKVAPYQLRGDRATRRQSYCANFYLSASVKKGQVAVARNRAPPRGGQLTDGDTTQRKWHRRDSRPAACSIHKRVSQRLERPPSARQPSGQRCDSRPQ